MTSVRGLEVLKAIVEDYVARREPVGSKGLVERHHFAVSAATIRNDMACLEAESLITAPHTSAGRIPTEKGYRFFVDNLHRIHGLSSPQRHAIERFLEPVGDDLDSLLEQTVRALAQLTNQLAVVQYPSLGSARIRHIGVVPVTADRLLVILVTDSGRLQQQIVQVPRHLVDRVDEAALQRLHTLIAQCFSGIQLSEAPAAEQQLLAASSPHDAPVFQLVLDAIAGQVQDSRSDRLVIAGAGNLLRTETDFTGSIAPVLDAIEEQVTLLRLMGQMSQTAAPVAVRIGHENATTELDEASVVAGNYGTDGEQLGQIGIVGPTRMDYRKNIAAVQAVARYLSTHLG